MSASRLPLVLAVSVFAATGTYGQSSDSFLVGGDPAAGEYTGGGATLAGENPSIAGWTGAWLDQNSLPTNASQVDDVGLTLGSLVTSAGGVQFPGLNGARTGRELSTPRFGVDETLYISFLMDATDVFQGEVDSEDFGNIVPGFTFAAFELHSFAPNDGQRELQISVGDNFVTDAGLFGDPGPSFGDFRGDYQLRIQNDNALAVNLGPNDGGTNLFVVKLDLSSAAASDTVTVYRNPEDLTDESASTIDGQLTGLDLSIAYTTFARFDPFFGDLIDDPPTEGAPVFFDELRLGPTYASVLPANAGVPGDANGDGAVDLLDLDILGANFGLEPATVSDGDFNGDGVVDLLDLDILGANFEGSSLGASVPEPALLPALLVSVALLRTRLTR